MYTYKITSLYIRTKIFIVLVPPAPKTTLGSDMTVYYKIFIIIYSSLEVDKFNALQYIKNTKHLDERAVFN